MKVLVRLHARELLHSGALRFVNTLVQFLPALCLSALLKAVEQGSLDTGFRAAAALFAALLVKAVVENQYFYRASNTSLRMRAMLQASIYRKSLRLPEAAAAVPPVTLMQVDTGKVENLALSAHTLWDGLFQVCGYSFLLIRYLGVAAYAGLVLLLATFPLSTKLQQRLSVMSKAALVASEERVSKTSEILTGIRAIRQMGWEGVYEREVNSLREVELVAQRGRANLGASVIALFGAIPPFMTSVVLLAYVMVAGQSAFSPAVVFTALSLLNQIRFPLLFYPYALQSLAEGRVALNRIADFLMLREVAAVTDDVPVAARERAAGDAEGLGLGVPAGRFPVAGPGGPSLVLPEAISVKPGELLGICGPVGSGKTSLLKALLGELPGAGFSAPAGRVLYCAQRPWIPSGKLEDVIAGGAAPDPAALKAACDAALVDFASPADEISAGTLSGGQQARVALARAVYQAQRGAGTALAPPACVLDDVAVALDPRAASVVTERCLFGSLRQAARAVVTGDAKTLHRCDRIVLMESCGKDLKVLAVGTHAELVGRDLLETSPISPLQPEGAGGTQQHASPGAAGDTAAKETPEAVNITAAEDRAVGAIPSWLYRRYLACASSPGLLAAAAVAVVGTYGVTAAQQWFVGLWTADTTLRRGLSFYVQGISLLGLVAAALTFVRSLMIAAYGRRVSRSVHEQLCRSVVARATTRWFDANPSGRILQRFAADLNAVDSNLPNNFRAVITCACTLIGAMVVLSMANPEFILLFPPLLWVYLRGAQVYRPVARELKRLEALARSPVYSEQAAAAEGVATIRQMRLGPVMTGRAFGAVDRNTGISFALKGIDRWFSLRMELLGVALVTLSAFLGLSAAHSAVAATRSWAAARAAVAITQALSISGLLNWTVRTFADMEQSFSSFQRVVHTADTAEPEGPLLLPTDGELPAAWPAEGRVTFDSVSMRYRDDLPLILWGVDLDIQPGKRVAIVGSTGSGKSTLLRALLRTVEIEPGVAGSVRLDGVDLQEVGLARLRSSITVIPQDNFVVTGTLRSNVDPVGAHTSQEILAALEAASLGHWPLERPVGPGGEGISPGERQLLGVARALLRRSRVVALDEVTSRVDEATDRKVQEALRQLPGGTTLLVVSHRIQTLEDYDTVVVMDSGRVVETGNPRTLLLDGKSRFAQLQEAELLGA